METEYGNMKNAEDEKLKFVPKNIRKKLSRQLREADKARNSTRMAFKQKYATLARTGNSLMIHLVPEDMHADGLHLSLPLTQVQQFMEDLRNNIEIWEVLPKNEESESNQEQPKTG